MATIVTSIPLLLLLVSASSVLRKASAVAPRELLEMLSLYSGRLEDPYVNGKPVDRDFMMLTQPVDIPALNQYFPLYYMDTNNGELISEGIYLLTIESDGTYSNALYEFKNISKYSTPDLDMSTITRDDLNTEPSCTEKDFRQDDETAVAIVQCFGNPDSAHKIYRFVSTCKYQDGSVDNSEDEFVLRFWKSELYPLPDSWLEGNEDYVDPCYV